MSFTSKVNTHKISPNAKLCVPGTYMQIGPDSPAIEAMTDFSRISVVTIGPEASLPTANASMIARGVRLLLVRGNDEQLLGLITARDIHGERPLQVAQTRGSKLSELLVSDIMVPVGSIEIGQVRVTTSTAGVVSAAQIYAVPGLHVERADYPVYSLDYATGKVTFAEALPLIHTGSLPKAVYIKGSTPLFAPISQTRDWVPAEATYSINSTDTYDGPVGSASSSLGQASFNAILKDGITDAFLGKKGTNIWIEFRPDRDKSVPKQLTQGLLGISRTFPAGGGSFSAACTVTPSVASLDVKA